MSGESSYPSAIRGDGGANPSASSNNSSAQAAPAKRKRNLPGTPDPEAEVIALSPKTLMATNRFVCEICNKGFQRDQNLQLHRRGHNLPWKLRQRTTKEIKKRVYICPEENCVHHDPSRALGDLTGIKKHYCRKHGEKKWKCDKCSKRYAVQSDWKAHSKTCGTREYRCDCGTLFSRRDSFITHRAFCDALAEESARVTGGIVGGPPQMPLGMAGANAVAIANHVMGVGVGGGAQSSPPRSNLMRLGASTQSDQFGFRQNFGSANTAFNPARPGGLSLWFGQGGDQQNLNMNPMDFSQSPKSLMGGGASTEYEDPTKINPSNLYPSMFASNDGGYGWNTQGAENRVANSTTQQQQKPLSLSTSAGHTTTNDANSNLNNGGCYSSQSAQMSATALLQKAAQMGATASNSAFRGFSVPVSNSSSMGLGLTWQNTQGSNHNNGQYLKSPLEQQVIADYVRGGENNNGLNDLMNSLSANGMLPLSGLNAYMDNDPCHNNAEGGFTGLGVISNRGNVNAMKEQSFQQQQTRAGLSPSPSLSSSSSMSQQQQQQQQQQQNHMMLSGAGSTHQKAVTLLSGMGNPARNGEDGAEGLTRDFLGVGAMQPRAFHHHQMGNAFSHLGVGGSGMDSIAASFNPPHGGDDLKPWETAT